jgi:hypothetical protein
LKVKFPASIATHSAGHLKGNRGFQELSARPGFLGTVQRPVDDAEGNTERMQLCRECQDGRALPDDIY